MIRRVEIIGKEIVTYGDKRLIGINLGFIRNDDEYQVGLGTFLQSVWDINSSMSLKSCCSSSQKIVKCFNDAKKIANGYEIPCYVNVMEKLAGITGKWYRDYMLPNYTSCVKRKVRIGNSELRKNNKVCQLVDGDYICLFINIDANIVKQKLGRKRIFSEDDFLYTPKYDTTQYYEYEGMQYYDVCDRHVFRNPEGFGSSWGRNASYLTIVMPYYNEWVIDQLIAAIKRGEIAFVQEEPSIFHNIGGLLLNVKDACNLHLINLCR